MVRVQVLLCMLLMLTCTLLTSFVTYQLSRVPALEHAAAVSRVVDANLAATSKGHVTRGLNRPRGDHREPGAVDTDLAPVLRSTAPQEQLVSYNELKTYVHEDWSACRIIFHLHIAKTGGHTLHSFTSSDNMSPPLPHRHFRFSGWNYEHAQEAVRIIRKELAEAAQIIYSAEVGYEQLQAAGYEWDAETCYIAHIREPMSWMASAVAHAERMEPRKPYSYGYFSWKNYQSKYIAGAGLWRAQSFTVVDAAHQNLFYRLLGDYYASRGHKVKETFLQSYSGKYSVVVDYSEWVQQVYPVDAAVYELLFGSNDDRIRLSECLADDTVDCMDGLSLVHIRGEREGDGNTVAGMDQQASHGLLRELLEHGVEKRRTDSLVLAEYVRKHRARRR